MYITTPIVASVVFNDPDVQAKCAVYFQFMKYPASPNTNLREEFEELSRKRELEREQRKEYAEQVRKLQDSAKRSREEREAALSREEGGTNTPHQGRWSLGWLPRIFGGRASAGKEEAPQ